MLAEPLVQWAFTVVFSCLVLFAVHRAVAERRSGLRLVGHLLHALMALGMVAMVWPWWDAVPVPLQVALFGGAALWFAGVGAAQLAGRVTLAAVGGHPPWHQFAHAVMMAAMVWMLAAMAGAPAAPDGAHSHGVTGPASTLTGVAATAGLVVTTVVLLVDATQDRTCRSAVEGRRSDAVAGAWMGAGMASMCWLMIAQ